MAIVTDTYASSEVTIQTEYDNAAQTGTYFDGFETIPVYAVRRIYYVNHKAFTYEIEVEGDNQFPRNFTVAPLESGNNGLIPAPQRFDTQPMKVKVRKQ